MRVTSGRLRGRPLAPPADRRVRPTSDKVRQAIFNVLEHADLAPGFMLQGARVIDLFAGTGALGIEALSRGARYALFVEADAAARALIRGNIERLGLTGVTRIWRRDATKLGPAPPGEGFDLAFLDPPYRKGLLAPALGQLHGGGWLKPSAVVVAETAADEDVLPTDDFAVCDSRIYGETRVTFLRRV